jgi:hypothetical protein
LAGVACASFGKPSFTPCAQDGDGGGHGSIVKDEE